MIIDANDINAARGEITGQAYDPVTGEMPAIELIPCAGTDDPECRSDHKSAAAFFRQRPRHAAEEGGFTSGGNANETSE